MSLNSSSSLISDPTTELTSYDIPLQCHSMSRVHDNHTHNNNGHAHNHNHHLNPYEDLPYLETTSFTYDTLPLSIPRDFDRTTSITNPIFNHNLELVDDGDDSPVSHGFFLGQESLQNLSVPAKDSVGVGSSVNGPLGYLEEDECDDPEDEGISEIYRPSLDPNAWVRRSDRSFKNSPEPTPRHALSKRIGNVGVIGQNIGLGHRLGVLTEDASLIPKKVKFQSSQFVIAEDSPVQTDVTWSKPDNASTFTSLVYKIEACLSDPGGDPDASDEWRPVSDVRWPTLRIYHTDDTLLVGKLRVSRRKNDVIAKIRVRCHGELVLPDRTRHWTMSSYSKTAEVTFSGYEYNPASGDSVQQTHL